MATSRADRILATPSSFCKEHFLYVQEVGTLTSLEPHISSRKALDSFLFFVVSKGKGILTYENATYSLETGHCVFINCRSFYSHESNAEEPWTLDWVHFYGEQAKFLFQEYQKHTSSPVFMAEDIKPFISLLQSLYQEQLMPNSLTEINCHRYLTDLVALCFQGNRPIPNESSSIQNKLLHIREYINAHYTEKLSLDSLAEDFYISKFHLAREYRNTFGITLGNDITQKRISKAKSLLRFTNASVETISLVCGFSDPGYFIKVFKKEEQMTPLEYRKKW